MHRRRFLQQAALGGAAIASSPALAATPTGTSAAAVQARVPRASLSVGEEVLERGIDDLQQAMQSGARTTRAMTHA
jgi:hypothetical protein